MKVNVEIITGTFIDAEVSENATVKELKEKIAKEVKLSMKRLILLVGGGEEIRRMVKDDEDEMELTDLGVKEDSHMYLFFKHPDFVCKEDRSQGRGDDASVEEVSSEAESKRGNKEEDEESKGEEEDVAKKNGGEEEQNGEETKDDDNVEEGENEMDRVT
ncbi:Ubiquitin-like superfamily protein [Hirschfeldia incana]|nr:Ubiquitin-like superfamily protein [Hirschfeldia incana]